MNYLKQITSLNKLDKEYSFSPLEIAIYMQLLWKCNDLSWKNPFRFGCDELRAKVKTTNKDAKKAFDTARNKLKQAGLIDFQKGNGRGNHTQYTLTDYEKVSEKGGQKDTLSAPLSGPFSGDKRGYINKSINKEKESVSVEQVHTHTLIKNLEEKIHQQDLEIKALREGSVASRRKGKGGPAPAVPPQLPLDGQTRPGNWQEVAAYFTERTGVNGKKAESFARKFISKNEKDHWLNKHRFPIGDWHAWCDYWIECEYSLQQPAPSGGSPAGSPAGPDAPASATKRTDYRQTLYHQVITEEERSRQIEWAKNPSVTCEQLNKAHERLKKIIQERLQNTS